MTVLTLSEQAISRLLREGSVETVERVLSLIHAAQHGEWKHYCGVLELQRRIIPQTALLGGNPCLCSYPFDTELSEIRALATQVNSGDLGCCRYGKESAKALLPLAPVVAECYYRFCEQPENLEGVCWAAAHVLHHWVEFGCNLFERVDGDLEAKEFLLQDAEAE